jgi:cytidine deaminase
MNKKVVELAIKMCEKAHAPFSNYKVGSAVEIITGEIIGGCNVESSSYGLTCCAERIALFKAITEGYSEFKSIAVATKNAGMPCGACRQIIWELCGDIPIYICNMNGWIKTIFSSELLPDAFDKKDLK